MAHIYGDVWIWLWRLTSAGLFVADAASAEGQSLGQALALGRDRSDSGPQFVMDTAFPYAAV